MNYELKMGEWELGVGAAPTAGKGYEMPHLNAMDITPACPLRRYFSQCGYLEI